MGPSGSKSIPKHYFFKNGYKNRKSSQNTNGRIHPVSQVLDEITEIFGSLGYEIADGPDIETEYYNFNALNIPESHPARQMHDTFYFDEFDKDQGQSVLRTHTSPVQVRTMEKGEPPFRFISPSDTRTGG